MAKNRSKKGGLVATFLATSRQDFTKTLQLGTKIAKNCEFFGHFCPPWPLNFRGCPPFFGQKMAIFGKILGVFSDFGQKPTFFYKILVFLKISIFLYKLSFWGKKVAKWPTRNICMPSYGGEENEDHKRVPFSYIFAARVEVLNA